MRATMAVIRLADEGDAGAMLAIYAPYVRETAISFELEPPSEGEFRRRVRSVREAGLWLLCEAGGNALGYAYAGRFHERRAYQWTVEVTAYVHADHHRKGVGLGLYTSLLGCLALQAFRSAVGVIALPNPASVGLHERMGVAPAGVLRAVGRNARRAGIEPGPIRDRVRLATGRAVRVPTGLGAIRIDGREAATIFWIGPCEEPSLGVETLEALGLAVDPAKARLRATRPYATRLGGFGRR